MFQQLAGPDHRPMCRLPGAVPACSTAVPSCRRMRWRSAMTCRWVCSLAAVVAICASGCATPNTAVPAGSGAATSISASAPDRSSYVGIHWIATQVSGAAGTEPIPTVMAVTVDFMASGSVVFNDGVNAVNARWEPGSGNAVRLDEVGSTAQGYVGHDSVQLAAILAVREMTSPSGDGQSGNQSAANITVTRTGGTLTLARNGVRISYRNAGPTAPEMTRSAPATTGPPARSSSASEPGATLLSATTHDAGATLPYDLLTHCGVREALIDNNYYLASPVLDDGNGNPPTGWGNPYDRGAMTIHTDGTADFRDTAGHWAHFVLRPGATTWLQLCA